MTADNNDSNTTMSQSADRKTGTSRKRATASRARSTKASAPAKRNSSRKTAAKRSRSAAPAAASKPAAARRGRQNTQSSSDSSVVGGKRTSVTSGIGKAASRIVSRGRRAASSAYDWASEGAGRAMPLARSALPDQRLVQRIVDERPYMLGAIGLGIGAMIGLMLPSPFATGAASRSASRSNTSGTASRSRSGRS